MLVYRCEDSLEGIFTAVYNSYEEKRDHQDTMISLDEECFLFAEYVPVKADAEKTGKVVRTLRRRFGDRDYGRLCLALSAPDPAKAQAVYQTIVAGLSEQCSWGHLFDNLTNREVHRAFTLARSAGREYDHLRGFVRFAELESGMLCAGISPKNNLVPFLMPHFADRFSGEDFVLRDTGRGLYGIHPAGREWFLLQDGGLAVEEDQLPRSAAEEQYRELFRRFCSTITIKERSNPKLQRSMLPLRFREYMTEF